MDMKFDLGQNVMSEARYKVVGKLWDKSNKYLDKLDDINRKLCMNEYAWSV